MKRVGHIYERMISNENIERAIREVNKGHRWVGNHKPNRVVLWVETSKPDRIQDLRRIINEGFEPIKPVEKRRYDRNAGKWRTIHEPRLWPDQYVHHILIQAIEPVLMRGMDPYCCGSIKNRGAHYGIKAIRKWMKEDPKGTKWCAELDVRHFYDELKPEVVMDRIRKLIKDGRVLDLCERVMKFDVTIGAYFSQWFANATLQPLDRKIRKMGAKHYIRYMDNFTIFSGKKRILQKIKNLVEEWLKDHGMELKDNWQIFRSKDRYPNALGYRYGKDFVLIRKKRLLTIKRQIRSFFRQCCKVSAKFALSLLSRIGGLKHCNAVNIFRRFIPKRLQRKLKNIVREYQRKELMEWNTCLEQYMTANA